MIQIPINPILHVGDLCDHRGQITRVKSLTLDYFGIDDELLLENGEICFSSEVMKIKEAQKLKLS